MERRPNPYYKPRPSPQAPGPRAWMVWRFVFIVVLAITILIGKYVLAAVFVASWLIGEVIRYRQTR